MAEASPFQMKTPREYESHAWSRTPLPEHKATNGMGVLGTFLLLRNSMHGSRPVCYIHSIFTFGLPIKEHLRD